MHFLVDMQLPPRLCAWLEQHGETAVHVSTLPDGATMADAAIWDLARRNGYVLLSKDRDFRDLMPVGGSPQLVYIALGNGSNAHLVARLEAQWDEIVGALQDGAAMVTVFSDRLSIYG